MESFFKLLKNVLSRTQIRECFMPDYGAIVKMQAKGMKEVN